MVQTSLTPRAIPPLRPHQLDGLAGSGMCKRIGCRRRGFIPRCTVDDLHDDPCARGGPGFFQNVLEIFLDGLYGQSHLVGDFLVGPALHEMADDSCFASGQAKLLLRLADDIVLPCADPGLVHHNEDALFPVAQINQALAAEEHGAMERLHGVRDLKLLPVLRVGLDLEDLPNLIGETGDGWREHAVCRFPALVSDDLLAQFPCPPILIEQLQRSREQHDAGPGMPARRTFLVMIVIVFQKHLPCLL